MGAAWFALLAFALLAAACSSATVDVGAVDTSTDADEDVDEPAEDQAPAETAAPATTATPTTAAPTTTAAPLETTVPAAEIDDTFEIAAEHAEYCSIASEAQVLEDEMGDAGFLEAASEVVEAFGETACGFTDEPVADGASSADEQLAEIEALLATEAGRQLFIEGLSQSMGITEEQGACFVDEVGAEGLANMAAMEESGEIDNTVVAELFAAFEICGIDAS